MLCVAALLAPLSVKDAEADPFRLLFLFFLLLSSSLPLCTRPGGSCSCCNSDLVGFVTHWRRTLPMPEGIIPRLSCPAHTQAAAARSVRYQPNRSMTKI